MANNIKSAKYLNDRIENIIKNGYTPITDFSHVKQNYNWILKPAGRKNSHLIMTYEEARSEMAKKIPDDPLTLAEYEEQLLNFQKEFGDRLTLAGEKRYQREHMTSIIEEQLEISTNRMSTDKLMEAFRQASKKQQENKYSPKYTSFYEYLADAIKELSD